MLRLNGFATAAFGKSHETAAWEVSLSGPTNRWPTRSGFDKFYGFIGGEANQWAPTLYEGLNQVEPPKDPNYHFLNDMTNKAIDWTKAVKSLTAEKPFFVYFAMELPHDPLVLAIVYKRILSFQWSSGRSLATRIRRWKSCCERRVPVPPCPWH